MVVDAVSCLPAESVFVPCGWDSEAKIELLTTGMRDMHPNDHYDDIIKAPSIRKVWKCL